MTCLNALLRTFFLKKDPSHRHLSSFKTGQTSLWNARTHHRHQIKALKPTFACFLQNMYPKQLESWLFQLKLIYWKG